MSPSGEPGRWRRSARGLAQAAGLALLARVCQAVGSGASSAGSAMGGGDLEAWGSLLAWASFVWLSKSAAAAGWWRAEGAWTFGPVAVAFLAVATGSGLSSWGWAAGWMGACLWSCLWPAALARLRGKGFP